MWASEREQDLALEDLEEDVLAPGTRRSDASRIRTMEQALGAWGLPLFPPSPLSVRALGASLKWGGYKSAAMYLRGYRVAAQRAGYPWGDVLARTHQGHHPLV